MTYCETCGHQFSDVCGGCETLDGVPVKYKKKTNGDRIRAMTDEELADFICNTTGACNRCYGTALCTLLDGRANGLLKWLKQEAET